MKCFQRIAVVAVKAVSLSLVLSTGAAGSSETKPLPSRAVSSKVVPSAAVLEMVTDPDACVPGGEATPMPELASEYAAMCAPHVGIPPTIDCGDGVRIPIHVDGVEVFEDQGPFNCDTPDFKGNCNVGSRIGRVQGKTASGEPLEDVVWAYLCRSAGQALFERGIGSVQMIGHNRKTGASCFFESPDAIGKLVQAEYLEFDEDGLLDGLMPGPESAEFDRAFIPPPPGVQCAECHQNNVFLHDPWIDGARLPSNTREPVLPQWVDPETPYWVVGGTDWDLRTPHIEGNTCLDCHRAPMRTASLLELGKLHVNEFMPPRKPGTMKAAYEELMKCHEDGPGNTPGCDWMVPPGGGCKGGIVAGTPGDGAGKNIPTGSPTSPFRLKDSAPSASAKPEAGSGKAGYCMQQCAAKGVSETDCQKYCPGEKSP